MGLSAGTAFVDVQPKIGAGFQGAIASKLGPLGVAGGAALAGGIAVGIGGAVALKNIGDTFDDAFDTIRVGTGALGEDLAGLQADFKATLTAVPTDAATAAAAIADLNTRTGATGETLREVAANVLELGRITGEDTGALIEKSTRLFGDWGVSIEEGGVDALDALFRASQATGPPVTQLADLLVRYGAPLRQFGFGMEQSAALLGKFEKEGVNTELVMGSLRIALGKLAKDGLEPAEALPELVDAIASTGSAAEANALAIDLFGARAGPDMAAAIREGRFELGELFDQVADGSETIRSAADDSSDYRESWTKFKNQVLVALEPLATKFLDAIGRLFDVLAPKIQPVIDTIIGAFGFLGDLFGGVADGADGATSKIGGILSTLGAAFQTVRDIVAPIFGGIAEVIESKGPVIAGVFAKVGDALSGLGDIFRAVLGALGALWDQWGGTIVDVIQNVVGTVIDVLSHLLDALGGVIDVIAGVLTGDWSRAWEGIKAIVGGIVGAIGELLAGLWDTIVDIARGIVSNFGDTIRNGFNAVVDFFRALPGRIFGFLASLPGRFLQLGIDLVTGLLSGLGDIVGNIGRKIRDGISGAIDSVKNFFGIGSPSRVIAAELGLPLAQGIAAGASQTAALAGEALTAGIRHAADRARREVPDAFTAGLAAVPLAVSSRAIADTTRDAAEGGTIFELAEGAVQVNNPTPEPASTSVPRELRKLEASLGRA